METPVLCTDNLFDDLLYSGHTVTANEEATGFEAWHVAVNRRSPGDHWTPTTANNDAWVEVACDVPRAADFLAIDRGHNLAGKTVNLQCSDDDFTTTETVLSFTMPSAYSHGSALSSGARTEEGAFVRTFDLRTAKYWRLHITAAASFLPKVVGLWVGKAWKPGEYIDRPWDEDGSAGAFEAEQNEYGWSAYGSVASPREGSVSLRLSSFFDDDTSRRFLADYRRGRPAWFVPQSDRAERAMLVKVPPQSRIEAPYETGWGYRTIRLPYTEHEPRL